MRGLPAFFFSDKQPDCGGTMTLMRILHYPDPVLRMKSESVTVYDEELGRLAENMAETMYAAPGVGLAAPQVGILKRLIVIDCASKGEPPELIKAANPEIVSGEGEVNEEEGCLSVPGYYANVLRYERVTVRYNDMEGKEVVRTADGLLAVAFQHEIDHLEGILFVDRLSPLKKSMFRKKYKKIMAQKEEEL